jgi:hypothetical protein
MVEKDLGERNFAFDSLKYMDRHREEKRIVARDCLPPEPQCPLPAARCPLPHRLGAARRETIAGNKQIDVEVEGTETSENLTQSFEIHYIVWRRTQLLAVIIYII